MLTTTSFTTEWFQSQSKFIIPIEEMTKEELNQCLKIFYAAVRQKDGKDFKVSSLRSIRAAIDRYLRPPAVNKPWSIVGDKEFNTANKVLNAICKKNTKEGKVSSVVHKQPITSEQVQCLFQAGQLGGCDTNEPAQLLRTTGGFDLQVAGCRLGAGCRLSAG